MWITWCGFVARLSERSTASYEGPRPVQIAVALREGRTVYKGRLRVGPPRVRSSGKADGPATRIHDGGARPRENYATAATVGAGVGSSEVWNLASTQRESTKAP
ncbi:hypothetical protein LK10_05425 [Sinomonas humi]|uniref:Uncharacterized protein n=1 Tax=Sinomonas humi TaxID=1338436 RepID=A0A0B2ALF4_9MICC|nr:hypothetical protein LK10_05425 [Sinomonas humi]